MASEKIDNVEGIFKLIDLLKNMKDEDKMELAMQCRNERLAKQELQLKLDDDKSSQISKSVTNLREEIERAEKELESIEKTISITKTSIGLGLEELQREAQKRSCNRITFVDRNSEQMWQDRELSRQLQREMFMREQMERRMEQELIAQQEQQVLLKILISMVFYFVVIPWILGALFGVDIYSWLPSISTRRSYRYDTVYTDDSHQETDRFYHGL